LSRGLVDDVLVHPFRALEVQSKIKAAQQILMWDEVSQINTSFAEIVTHLKDDLKLAERLQIAKLPIRFPDVSGFKITQRYMAGLRSGGDYFDIAESRQGNLMSIVLSDSSSYGLSSQVLSVLMRVALKLTTEEVRSTYETVKRIQNELGAVLGDNEKLSLFYGVLSRRDYRLKYLNLGSSCAFYADKSEPFRLLPSQGNPITRRGAIAGQEAEIQLQPDGRLLVISDGFLETFGGMEKLEAALQGKRGDDAKTLLNELVFGVKSKLDNSDDMPVQDCTAAIFDVDSRIMRLASG
jgi:serine phosphatase RsbU (regulator of sigma subunit)